jgi:DNA polymerase (family 10)
MVIHQPNNDEVAKLLDQIADLLEAQKANVHRVCAYRTGAQSVRNSKSSVAELVGKNDHLTKLEELHGIGEGLARTIAEIVSTGQSRLLDRLQGEISPEDLFVTVPGIGETLSTRIVRELNIHSLEELELAAHDGRLRKVQGFSDKRIEAVQLSLGGLLSRSVRRRISQQGSSQLPTIDSQPSIAALLDVEKIYRKKAEADELKKIAPRRFNSEREAWLPIMHAERNGWSFTALFSNTELAHELGLVKDWVVLYFDRNGYKGQATVVTETHGLLQGKRVIRGREEECKAYYRD